MTKRKEPKKEYMPKKHMPLHISKLAVDEQSVIESVKHVLADYNIYHLTNEQIKSLFYGIIGNMIKYLDTYPGYYFKLELVDIYKDDDKDLLKIKGSSEYAEEIVDADLIFNRFCSEQRMREELQNELDIFTQSFFKKREKKYIKAQNLSTLIRKREQTYAEAAQITKEIKGSKKYKQYVLKQRKQKEKEVRAEARKRERAGFVSNVDLLNRKQYADEYKQLELQLRRQWIQDKNKFPIEVLDN